MIILYRKSGKRANKISCLPRNKYYVPPLRETRDFSFKEYKNTLWKYMYEIDLNEVLLYK